MNVMAVQFASHDEIRDRRNKYAPRNRNAANPHPIRSALLFTAENMVHVISYSIAYRTHRAPNSTQSLRDCLNDREWIRQAKSCAEAGGVETRIRAAAWREASHAICAVAKKVIARYNGRRGLNQRRVAKSSLAWRKASSIWYRVLALLR